ncbi:helix-turn-helix domain-containing protein [Alkalihalobacillus pseudalcaliphilus]|uniref:helix-turn-helix domain-containing protein n=1 Tax=Alkalihalobacillus pseudalcaliphilus TaxID=79884 RepID=UPI00064DA01A|nr:helix-turn-helix domain-containing protein [Alkalihalobacillus pseudalcaliphilus]KMK75669.1 hypothetical protein AB990_10315 [Alkalihalobacillus pseudalcaliphilus]
MHKDKLLRLFGQVIVQDYSKSDDSYLWLNVEGTPIGFERSKLTEKEMLLLNELYPKYVHIPLPKTIEENSWKQWLDGSTAAPNKGPIRFIHFSLEQPIEDFIAFQDIWEHMLERPSPIIWFTPYLGVIINVELFHAEETDFTGLIDAVSSDFYVDMSILIGHTSSHPNLQRFQLEQNGLLRAHQMNPKKKVFVEHEINQYHILSFMPVQERTKMLQLFLPEEIIDDHELIQSITVFFETNLNLSLAAKKLHMHRNSLQYRLDKFIDKTGFDIKQFSEAAFVQFLLLLLPIKNHT